MKNMAARFTVTILVAFSIAVTPIGAAQPQHSGHVASAVIDGALTPEQISDRSAYRLWLSAVAVPATASPENRAIQRGQLLSLELDAQDYNLLTLTLSSFYDNFAELIAEHNRDLKAQAINLRMLDDQPFYSSRDALVDATIAALGRQLSSSAMDRLTAHVRAEKGRMIVAPDNSTASSSANPQDSYGMTPNYSVYSSVSFDPISQNITQTVTIQGNTTFPGECTYCYSAWHKASAFNQVVRQDTGAVVAGGWTMVANVQPPSVQINNSSYTSFNPSTNGPGPFLLASQGEVTCTLAGLIWGPFFIPNVFLSIADSSYLFAGWSSGRCSWIPTCTGSCSSPHTTNPVGGKCYSGNNRYKLCFDLLMNGSCWAYRAWCIGSPISGPCS